MNFLTSHSDSVDIQLTIQPRSSENKIVGVMDARLKLKIKAPPVDGAANKMCIQFLSKSLHIPKSHIEIISGESSRKKQVRIMGDPTELKNFFKSFV
ncbi:MAG: YggU family protein [Candidatus Magnetomorum sp.]|nr:YggU family protein [Candidatus Magnetomorum sp.]